MSLARPHEITASLPCQICGKGPAFRWSDVHGVGACLTCGAIYRLTFYDASGVRYGGEPQLLLDLAWVPVYRQYWRETGHSVAPRGYNNVFFVDEPSEREEAETALYERWMFDHAALLPVTLDPAA